MHTVMFWCLISSPAMKRGSILDSYTSTQNYRVWSLENPHIFQTMLLHPQKIGAWCVMSYRRVVGPIFFETVITAEAYRYIIQQFIALLHEDEHNAVFQQDNA